MDDAGKSVRVSVARERQTSACLAASTACVGLLSRRARLTLCSIGTVRAGPLQLARYAGALIAARLGPRWTSPTQIPTTVLPSLTIDARAVVARWLLPNSTIDALLTGQTVHAPARAVQIQPRALNTRHHRHQFVRSTVRKLSRGNRRPQVRHAALNLRASAQLVATYRLQAYQH